MYYFILSCQESVDIYFRRKTYQKNSLKTLRIKIPQIYFGSYFELNLCQFIDPKKTIDTGSGRVDPNGQMKEKKKQWRLSESHLTEVSAY